MTARGFLMLELLLAIALMSVLTIALFSLATALPRASSSEELRASAVLSAGTALAVARREASFSFDALSSGATTTDAGFLASQSMSLAEDDSFAEAVSQIAWKNLFGIAQSLSLNERLANASSTQSACDPFVSGDWSRPVRAARYTFAGDLLPAALPSQYTLAALATTPQLLIAGIGSTTSRSAPTLLFFSLQGDARPAYIAGFDNASSSRIGFTSIAVGSGTVFAGNGFGSASAATCSDGTSCAQVQAFATSGSAPQLLSAFTFATSSPPYARTTSGATAAVRALAYKNGSLFVGLEKTAAGDEFNILDAHDPRHLSWLSGLALGHGVTGITVREGYAYLATDDASRELTIVDARDPAHPRIVSSFDAPGASGFGFGSASTIRAGIIRFVRTYSPNGKEFELIDAHDPSHLSVLQEYDGGTATDPESGRALLTQDWLSFALFTHRLEFWNTGALDHMTGFGAPYMLPVSARAAGLACKNDRIYVGYTLENGESAVDVLHGS